jgi:hypothetical protein
MANLFEDTKFVILSALALIIIIILGVLLWRKPTTATYVSTEAMVEQTPSAILTPFMCWITETTINCQATNEVILRRGQKETRFTRGSVISWKNPIGTGKGQIWFGCTGSNSCDGQPIFSSGSIKVESNSSGATFVSGKEDIIPFGSLGIIETNVENNKFKSIANRWAGAIAPPILRAGSGTTISCVDDSCTISLK